MEQNQSPNCRHKKLGQVMQKEAGKLAIGKSTPFSHHACHTLSDGVEGRGGGSVKVINNSRLQRETDYMQMNRGVPKSTNALCLESTCGSVNGDRIGDRGSLGEVGVIPRRVPQSLGGICKEKNKNRKCGR